MVFDAGLTRPSLFASWHFFESEQSYTPIQPGPVAVLDSSSYYKVSPSFVIQLGPVAVLDSSSYYKVSPPYVLFGPVAVL